MNTSVNSNQNISTEARAAGAVTFTPAQLGDLANHILCYGAFLQKFDPRLLPAGAQAEMFRYEESPDINIKEAPLCTWPPSEIKILSTIPVELALMVIRPVCGTSNPVTWTRRV